MGINSSQKKRARADIAAPPIAPGADAWRQGDIIQIVDPTATPHAHGTGRAPAP
jgi:hypothetical protein